MKSYASIIALKRLLRTEQPTTVHNKVGFRSKTPSPPQQQAGRSPPPRWCFAVASMTAPLAHCIWRGLRWSAQLPADDDHDDLSNFEEYAFGLDPKDGGSIQAVTSLSSPSIGRFNYTRRKASLTGLNYAVWWSESLAADSWAKDSGAVETVISTAGDVETLQVTLSPSLLSLPKLFLRVSAITP